MMNRRRPTPARTRARRQRQRGFTLVELLVAMAAGLLVSMAAFLLSKNATRFFQNEARASASHLAATLAMNRIVADLQRASHLSSPNVQRDPFVCGSPGTWPDGMRRIAGVAIQRRGSVFLNPADLGHSIANSLWPDSLVVGGSFNTTEQFYFNSINCTAGGCVVNIDPFSGAVQRTLARESGGGESLSDIFRVGRVLRLKILGQSKTMYGVIQGSVVAGVPPATIQVNLATTPALPQLQTFGDCGVSSGFNGAGGFANPVSRVRYEIQSLLSDPTYAPLVAPVNAAMTGDNGRTELVRVELDADDQPIDGTRELIAEYAVDLKFGLSATSGPEGGPFDNGVTNPQIIRYPITSPVENPNVYLIGADNTQPGAAPERVRTVQVRLSVRSRAPDRSAFIAAGPDGRRNRFLIPGIVAGVNTPAAAVPAGAPPVFARMRTLYADVALPNQAVVPW
ncbi:hypothetical protein SOCE26_024490 [Sorangium cellulosum]|uniref:Prepilin-type N-terminal cleavage/methylation domain-containing protein n=1 Tax=Sorangium cellulosum TaxID=56 RepID=A0A2L0EP13_SORCE|nr:prepilin-type N-terminal cleavage/methylation domain-containing protein [Sorangium cellulosum]AUX41044.1 hypothetical protein SOCE26_024490 [Sorangium cellulosum]